jgi:glycosyltransferase involved in cell wall biosynthesis
MGGAAAVSEAAAAPPAISIVTTCKGRLSMLQQSLPRMVTQPRAEVIVVDYDCPDGAGAWVATEYPAVRLVRVADAPLFNIARARNLGARAARGEWLCFVDSDILLEARFIEQALPRLRAGAFYTMASPEPDAGGSTVCRRADFVALEGYDEVLQDWGPEDRDLYIRLVARGCAHETLPGDWIQVIKHDDAARVNFYGIKDRWLSQRINASYSQIKHDLARQFGTPNLSLDMRRAIHAQVCATLQHGAQSGNGSARIQITLPSALDVRLYGWHMKRTWVYEIEPAPAHAATGEEAIADAAPEAHAANL